jgi:hypothetical protein
MCKGFYDKQMRVKNGRYTSARIVISSDIIHTSAGNLHVQFIKKPDPVYVQKY